MGSADVTVVIPTRDRSDVLGRCLRSLARLPESPQLIVVDNSTGDPRVRAAAEAVGATVIVEPRIGVSRARNAGGRAAAGALVAFIDDDAVPEPDWLTHHVRALQDPRISGTTGRVLAAPAGSEAAEAYAALATEDLGDIPFRIDRHSPWWFERANFGGVGVGPNIVLRRRLFLDGWGFPEHLGPADGIPGEEHYALYSLIREGHTIAYIPESVVHHDAPPDALERERRRLRVLRGSAVYLVMLLVEERGYRMRAARYALHSMRGRTRAWRTRQPATPMASRREIVHAAMRAPFAYVRLRGRTVRR